MLLSFTGTFSIAVFFVLHLSSTGPWQSYARREDNVQPKTALRKGLAWTTAQGQSQSSSDPTFVDHASDAATRHLAVTGLELWNANTNTKIVPLVEGAVIYLSDIAGMATTPALNIQATATGRVSSMKFSLDANPSFRIENKAPFTLCGNKGIDFFNCSSDDLGLGSHTVTATPHRFRRGRGKAGTPVRVTFSILARRDTPAPVKAPTLAPVKAPTTATTKAPTPSPVAAPMKAPTLGDIVAPVKAPAHAPTSAPVFAPFVPVAAALALDIEIPKLLSLEALSSTTINVGGGSAANAEVKFRLKVQDNESGIKSGHLKAGSWLQEFALDASMVGQPISLDLTLAINQFSAEGTYPLSIYVRDAAGNEAGFYAVDLESRSFPSTIILANLGEASDSNPPRLFSLTALTPTMVDISNGNSATVAFRVVAQDDLSGVQKGELNFGGLELVPVEVILPEVVTGVPVTFDMNVTIPPYTDAGTFAIDLILEDVNGYDQYYSNLDLANRTFPSKIQIINTRNDTSSPELVSLTIKTPMTINVTDRDGELELELVAFDTESGFESAELLTDFAPPLMDAARSLSVAQSDEPYTGNAFTALKLPKVASGGLKVGFPMRLKFSRHSLPGEYPLKVLLYDRKNNEKVIDATALSNLNLPSKIIVVNSKPDVTAPTLVNFRANPTRVVNVTLSFQVTVQDLKSGFDRGSVVVMSPNASNEVLATMEFSRDAILGGSANSQFVFDVSFVVPMFTPPGEYPIQITLYDVVQNVAVFPRSYLTGQTFPSFVRVHNLQPATDFAPPTLVSLVSIFPKEPVVVQGPQRQLAVWQPVIDVTFARRNVTLTLIGRDLGTGVTGGLITVKHKDSNRYYTEAFAEFLLPSGREAGRGDAGFNVTIPFEQFIKNGTYLLDLYLSDSAYNTANLTSPSLQSSGHVYKVEVINSRVDIIKATLVNMTAVTPINVKTVANGPPPTVTFQFTVVDNLSGLQTAALWLDNWFTPPIMLDLEASNDDSGPTGVGAPLTFRANFTIPNYVAAGNYPLSIELTDMANNTVSLDTATLLARGFPAVITVVK